MKKRSALALAAIIAICSLTACDEEQTTESQLREQIAKLESELNNKENNSDNTENDSTSTANIFPSSENNDVDHDANIHSDSDGNPVFGQPEQANQYPDMFDVLPEIEETPVSGFEYEWRVEISIRFFILGFLCGFDEKNALKKIGTEN